AAGSVETILAVQGIAAGQRPGTVNLSQQDERCQLRMARHAAAVSSREVWGKLSLGFGGHVACGLFVAD
ncbi:MAG: beta-ketoacyl-[acyl-carrier-protein] synthase II, partial [Planctomycetaceae bacterium]